MGYKNNDRCLEKVDEDEPIFVLRAQDRLAPFAVEEWLMRADPTLTDEHRREARDIISAMREWQVAHPNRVKLPD